MKNIISYTNFINEGLFNKKNILFDKLLKLAKEIPASKISSRNNYDVINRLVFTYDKMFFIDTEIDPFGEDFGDLKSIDIEANISSYTEEYKLLVNNKETSLTDKEAGKIYNILYEKYITYKSEEICRDLGVTDLYYGLVRKINAVDPNEILKGAFDKYTIMTNEHIIEIVKKDSVLHDSYELVIDNDIFPLDETKTSKLALMLKNKYNSFHKNQRDAEIEIDTDFL